MNYHFNITDQIRRLLSRREIIESLFTNPDYDPNNLSDITHGKHYRNFLESDDGSTLKQKRAFTLLVNTDGIQISLKSTLSIWPVYIVINDLPKSRRFKFQNIIIAGIK